MSYSLWPRTVAEAVFLAVVFACFVSAVVFVHGIAETIQQHGGPPAPCPVCQCVRAGDVCVPMVSP